MTTVNTSVPLSVVMPVYNEEEAIALAVDDVQRHVLAHVAGAELVVVNDGSRDRTGELLDGLAAKDTRVRVIHQKNAGHGGAVMAALAAARGEYVFLIDSDRQIPLDDFPRAWREIAAGHDAVFGVRRRRYDPALRLYLTKVIRGAVNLLFGVRLYDANVPYKLLRKSIWEEARLLVPAGTLAPSLFLAIIAKVRGHDIVEVDVVHKERDTGEVSIRRMKLLKFCATGLSQMLELRRRLSRRSREAEADVR
jgi:glycosyltransferase involved in cell wall biosynthesis